MKRSLPILLAALTLSQQLHAADLSILNGGDFSAAAALEHISRRGTSSSDIEVTQSRRSALDSIVIDGVEWQATCFWSLNSGKLVIAVRQNRGSWTSYHYNGQRGLSDVTCQDVADAHYSMSLAIDPAGLIHVGGNVHNDPIEYYRSTAAIDAWDGTLTADQSVLNTTAENQSSYVHFIRGRNDAGFFCTYRGGGGAGDANQYLAEWNGTTWAAADGTSTDGIFISGADDELSPYVGYVDFSADWDNAGTGYMHMAWNWYDYAISQSKRVSHVRYNGATFSKMGGSQTVPITFANCDAADDVASGSNLSSWPCTAVDSQGRPHIAYIYDATDQVLRHAYYNGSAWVAVTARQGATAGTLADYSRPDIVVDANDVAHIVYLNLVSRDVDRTYSAANDYTSWSDQAAMLDANDSNYYSAVHDRWAWHERGRYEAISRATATPPHLLNGLAYYVPLDESSDGSVQVNRRDDIYSALFTDTTTTPSTASGKFSNGAIFAGSTTENLKTADNATNSPTGDLVLDCYAAITDKTATRCLVGKWDTGSAQRSYAIFYSTTIDRFFASVSSDGSTQTNVTATNAGAPVSDQMYHIVMWVDTTNDTLNISVDGVDETPASYTTGVYDGTAALRISGSNNNVMPFYGRIDEVALWTGTTLTEAQRDLRYSSGAGYSFAQMNVVAPTIYSHDDPDTIAVDVGVTDLGLIKAYGDEGSMSASLSGADAGLMDITDNNDGTFSLAFLEAEPGGNYEVTVEITNAAGTDTVDLTIGVPEPGGDPRNYDAFGGGTIP